MEKSLISLKKKIQNNKLPPFFFQSAAMNFPLDKATRYFVFNASLDQTTAKKHTQDGGKNWRYDELLT